MSTKNYSKKIVLLFLGFLLAYPTFSQENYVSGYILQSGGDTIYGYIDYRNWNRNPDKVSFKKDENGSNTIYTPLNCMGFGVQDEKYESGIIKTELSPTRTSQVDENPALIITTDTTFLQVLIQGEKSLYYFINDMENEQFYIKKDTAYELLIYKRYIKSEFKGRSIVENKNYIGQLLIYLNDSPTVKTETKNLEYRRKSLQNFFLTYYESKNLKPEFEKKIEKVGTEFGVLAGFSFIPEHNSSSSVETYHSEMSLNMSFGLSLNIILPRTLKKWSFYNELVYVAYFHDAHQVSYEDENIYVITDHEDKRTLLKMNNNLRFQYPFGNATAYAYFGVSNGIGIQRIDYDRHESHYYSIVTVEEAHDLGNTTAIEVGLNLGIGFSYNRFSFAAGLDSFYRYNFLLGYKL